MLRGSMTVLGSNEWISLPRHTDMREILILNDIHVHTQSSWKSVAVWDSHEAFNGKKPSSLQTSNNSQHMGVKVLPFSCCSSHSTATLHPRHISPCSSGLLYASLR